MFSFNKIKKDIELSGEMGGVTTCRVPASNQYTLNQLPVVRTCTCDLEHGQWNPMEENNSNNVFQDGLLIYGMSGNGKTTKPLQLKMNYILMNI